VQSTPTPQAAAPVAESQPKTNIQAASEEVLRTLPDAKAKDAAAAQEIEDDGADLEAELSPKEVQKLKKKLKVQGKEIEVDEDELVKRAQMGYSAEEKWQEAAKMRKQVEGFIGLLQKDPGAALEQLGFDVDALAEARIQQRIEEMKKTPEQLELEKIRRENEQIKSEREKEKQEAQEREMTRMQEQFATQIESEINEAMDAPDFGLPNSPYFVKRIADVMIYGLKNNKDISAKRAAEIVRDEVKGELQQMYTMAPDELFEQMVGKDRLNKYRRGKIKPKSKAPVTPPNIQSTGVKEMQEAQAEKPTKKVSARDFFKTLGSK